MKILTQIGIIFLIYFLGEFITRLLPFAFPSSVMCMIILLILYFLKVIKKYSIKQTVDFLLNNMAFFFVPAGVSMIKYFGVLQNSLVQILIICTISTVVVFGATAYTIRFVVCLENKLKSKRCEKNA